MKKVALLRSFDFEEEVSVFTPQGSWPNSFEALMSWIAAKRVPALIPGSEQTEKFFLQDIDPGNGLVLYFGEDEQLRRDLHELAVSFRSDAKLKWAWATDAHLDS
ncbi:PDIA4 [Symbiodinium sp. KB8]|nr:PDIA4 [Symbiodinium sp. KB8]